MTEIFCDNCANVISDYDYHNYPRLPVHVGSANAGESAVLCHDCHRSVNQIVFHRRNLDRRAGFLKS